MPHSTVGTTVIEAAGILPASTLGLLQIIAILWAVRSELRLRTVSTAVRGGIHEVRRPLQLLMLAGDSADARETDAVWLAASACSELEASVAPKPAGRSLMKPGEAHSPVSCDGIIDAALDRWSPLTESAGRSIQAEGASGDAKLPGGSLAPALDNLVSNAIVHGRGSVTIAARRRGRRLEIAVRDEGPRVSGSRKQSPLHGHGLAATRRYLRELNGELRLRRSPRGTVATMSIPVS